MTKPMSKMLLIVSIFFAIIFGIYGAKQLMFMIFMKTYQPPPVTVSSTTVTTKSWQSYLTSVGTLTAINGVDISAEVSGIVKEIRFNSGQMVKRGDVLLLLDTSIEQATLKDSEAKLTLAQMNFDREKKLFNKNVTSQASLDQREAELLQAEAGVESAKARIQQKTITAPFDGRLGIRQVDIGEYLSPGALMVTLQSVDPLFVNLTIPEQYLPELYINQKVEVSLNFGSGKTVSGTITAINSKVDPVTRNVLVQATIPNGNHQLYPGMFASAKIWLKAKNDVVVIPQTAVSYSLSGDYVFVIHNTAKEGKDPIYVVRREYVKIGEHRDDEVSILQGLTKGDLIITSGQLKLQNETHVVIDNSVEL